MKKFYISNKVSGVFLGVYEGETKEDALNALARDAGYKDYAHYLEMVGAKNVLLVEEVTDESGVE